jgi:hypothetical protein
MGWATAGTKAAIAALVAGAGQGAISTATKAVVAALPTTLRDGFLVGTLYNAWTLQNSKFRFLH